MMNSQYDREHYALPTLKEVLWDALKLFTALALANGIPFAMYLWSTY